MKRNCGDAFTAQTSNLTFGGRFLSPPYWGLGGHFFMRFDNEGSNKMAATRRSGYQTTATNDRTTRRVTTAVVLSVMGLAAAATPMARVYLHNDEADEQARLAAPSQQFHDILAAKPSLSRAPETAIVVDFADNLSRDEVSAVSREFNLNFTPNSVVYQDDKVTRAVLAPGDDMERTLAALRADNRVEAAEIEQVYTVPEGPFLAGPTQMAAAQTVTDANSLLQQAQDATARSVQRAGGEVHPFGGGSSLTITEVGPGRHTPYAQTETPCAPESFTVDGEGYWQFPSTPPRPAMSPLAPRFAPDLWEAYGTRPNDPRYDEQWNFKMVGAEDAWKRSRGKGVVVAVIDTGVAAKTTGRGKQARDFGATAFTNGYDFVNDDKDPYDDHGHGTHVAGTIAESTNNNEGVAGLAFESTIMPLKVLSASGSGTSADIADAIRWAADHGANVINMSLGSPYPSEVIHKAVKYARKKNVTIVCAAGNGFGEPVGYPAAFPECIAVSSVGPTGEIATYSSYGKQVALAAPGGDMMQSGDPKDGILQNTVYPESQGGKGDDYYAFQGTSMASPHVAAVAALIVAQGVTDPARVRDILVKTAQDRGEKNKYGAGILAAGNATKVASQETGGKLRYPVWYGLACLLMLSGGGALGLRSLRTRAIMALALAGGFFGADLFTALVGADSAWNLLGFSALAPLVLVAAFWNRKGTAGVAGLKIAGALALGVFVNQFANWHNGTIPFTTATFGSAAIPWTAANLGLSLLLANVAGWRAVRRAAPSVEGEAVSDWV